MSAAKRRARRAKPAIARDTDETVFARILGELVTRVPGALGAVLVDGEGECVDYAGRLAPFDIKLAGAHWQIIAAELRSRPSLGAPTGLLVRALSRSFAVHALPDDYVLVLVLGRRAGFNLGTRAFAACIRALASEASWRMRKPTAAWFPLAVEVARTGSPVRLRHGRLRKSLEILGRVTPLAPRERGWRVRLENGAEVTLIREPGNHWYADEPLDALFTPSPASKRSPPRA